MSETMGLALLAGTVVVILLQVAVLLRGNRRQDQQESEARFRGLQEAYDKAVWLNPATRAKQIERETLAKAAEARKGAEKKAAEVRKATAANVRAKPKSASAATPLGSMDESLEATLAAIKARG